MNIELTQKVVLRMRDCDADGRWKRSAMLRQMQEIGEDHAAQMGFSRARLVESGMCWVLYRQAFVMDGEAVLGDEITMTTWPGEVSGLFFPRYHHFEKDGRLIGEAATSWVLFDIEKRRVLRPSALPGGYRPGTDRVCSVALPGAIALEGLAQADARRVRYTDLDLNGHMNNARYADWVQDLLPGRVIGKMQLNYVTEGRLDDEAVLSMRLDKGRAVIAGVKQDGKKMFEAEAYCR